MFHRPVCAKCQTKLKPVKYGVGVIDYNQDEPESFWEADLYRCPKCGIEIVCNFGQQPWAKYSETEKFGRIVDAFRKSRSIIESHS